MRPPNCAEHPHAVEQKRGLTGLQPTWPAAFLPFRLCHHVVAGHAAEPWSVGRLMVTPARCPTQSRSPHATQPNEGTWNIGLLRCDHLRAPSSCNRTRYTPRLRRDTHHH